MELDALDRAGSDWMGVVGLDPSSSCSLQPMVTSMMEQSPEELGDLYLDVAEAFMDKGEYGSALPLLSALVCSERYNLAVVWLRHAGVDVFCCICFDTSYLVPTLFE